MRTDVRLWVRGPVGVVMLSVLAWSVVLDVVAVGGARLIDPQPELGLSALTSAWKQWDANWYERIVTSGYHAMPDAVWGHSPIYLQTAFYPGYPLVARGVFDVLHPVGVGIAGAMLVTNQALIFPMAFLVYSLAVSLTHRTDVAVRTVHYLLLFPFAYFLLAPYSETTFLTFVAGFAWALTTRRYALAGLFGALAGATRVVGFVLPLILIIGYLEHHEWNMRAITPRIVFSVIGACVGTCAFVVYQWLQFGSPLYDQMASHYGWAHSITLNLWRVLTESVNHPLLSAGSVRGIPVETFISFPLVVGFGILATVVWRKFGVALGLMCWTFMIVPVLSGTTLSWNRYMLPLLPCFVVLALWGRRSSFDFVYRTAGSMLLALFLVMFTHGIWTG